MFYFLNINNIKFILKVNIMEYQLCCDIIDKVLKYIIFDIVY